MYYFNNHKKIEGDYDLKSIQIIENIGSGNSSVYSAKVNDKIMALKEIVIKNEEQAASVHKEIELMKSLSALNPNIIKYQGYFFTIREMGPYNKIKFAYIIMEKGITSLESIIQRKKKLNQNFKDQQIQTIFSTLINTLLFLQQQNIAHCDIKPENVIIMNIEKMEIKICDIGSCKVIQKQQTEQSTLVGTVPFLAPQLVKHYNDQRACTNPFKSDVFSLGLCLIYILTFKKFKSNQRLKIDEKLYRQIINEWIKQCKQRRVQNKLISLILDSMLEFDQKSRVEFNQLKNVFQSGLEILQNKKKQQKNWIQKKMQEQQLQKMQLNNISLIKSTLVEESMISQKQLSKTLNRTGFKNKPKQNLKIQTSKIQKNKQQTKGKLTSKQSIHSPIPAPLMRKTTIVGDNSMNSSNVNPLMRKPTTLQSLPQGDSPTKSKKSSPDKMQGQQKQKLDVNNGLLLINRKNAPRFEDIVLNWQDKKIILNTNYWQFNNVKGLSIIINQNFNLFDNLQNLDKFSDVESLVIDLRKFKSIIQQKNFQQKQQKLKNIKKLQLILKNTQILNYGNLFQIFLTKDITKLYINLEKSTIPHQQFLALIQNISASNCLKLEIILKNLNIDQKVNKNIMESFSKSSLTSLFINLQDNNININAVMPWPLPKKLQHLTLNYKNNKIGVALNSLCLSFQKSQIRYLNLNFSNCHLSSKQINFLFTYICKIPKLQVLILDISYNRIDDQAVRYIFSKADQIFISLQIFQLHIHGTDISVDGWLKLISLVDRVFNKFKMSHYKISYDRYAHQLALIHQIKLKNQSENIKSDLICMNNQYFWVYFRKKPIAQNKLIKNGTCHRLIANHESQNHYLCLTCKQQKQVLKNRYYCQFCINNCFHKNHNFVKIYFPAICSCPYSGECRSDNNELICSINYNEDFQKGFYCLKCNKEEYCLSCIIDCRKDHGDYVREYKQATFFQCKHEEFISQKSTLQIQ